MSTLLDDADHPPIANAAVIVDGSRVEYRRIGEGTALLLLRASSDDSAADRALIAALASRFRVIIPARATDGARGSVTSLIRHLLDGLGIERVVLVVDAAFGADALCLYSAEPDRLAALVVLTPAADYAANAPGPEQVGIPASRAPLYLVHSAGDGFSDPATRAVAQAILQHIIDGAQRDVTGGTGRHP